MARYTGSVCRICRRENLKLYLKGDRCYSDKCAFDRRSYPPGEHGQRRGRKISDYGIQLREKQKVKKMFGLSEKQFKLFFMRADRQKGVTGTNLLIALERRLDNVVYRLGFVNSRSQGRHLVRHNHFVINGQKVFISNGQLADLVVLAAKTDPEAGAKGISLFLVPKFIAKADGTLGQRNGGTQPALAPGPGDVPSLAQAVDRLQKAADLYRGEFLAGFSLSDSPPFEEWMLLQQEHLHGLAVKVLCRLVRCHTLRGEDERALQCARRHVQLEPWREDAHRQVMRLLAAAGQRSAALAQYGACRQILEAELGVEPEQETEAIYRSILDGNEPPPDATLPPHNLPVQLTPFVGREAELDDLDRQTHAVLVGTAPFVRALVRMCDEELVEKIAFGAHDLDHRIDIGWK